MRINDGNKVVSFTHLPHDDEEKTEAPVDNSEPEAEAETEE
jgi:hypothetical protein